MMRKINITIEKAEKSYKILIGKESTKRLLGDLKKVDRKIVVITDSNVKKLYADNFVSRLKQTNDALLLSFPAGEKSKSRRVKQQLEDAMLKLGVGRDSLIIAFGGGIVGDLAGFVAATYMRGIPFVQVPTTLLAMVDSSVGGKVGINTDYGKNLLGAFYQPNMVYINPDFLDSLTADDYDCGLIEALKMAVILDKTLFDYIEANAIKIRKRDKKVITRIIEASCRLKRDVIELDEEEKDFRRILNFGHTIAHAIEKLTKNSISHGKAVCIGMITEALISNMLGVLSSKALDRLIGLMEQLELKQDFPDLNPADIIEATELDKKSVKGTAKYSLLKSIGTSILGRSVDENVIIDAVSMMKKMNAK